MLQSWCGLHVNNVKACAADVGTVPRHMHGGNASAAHSSKYKFSAADAEMACLAGGAGDAGAVGGEFLRAVLLAAADVGGPEGREREWPRTRSRRHAVSLTWPSETLAN